MLHKKAQLNEMPPLIIQLGLIAIVIAIIATVVTDTQTSLIKPSDYVGHTDTNVTFTDGYATLDNDYCTSIDAVVVPE